MPLKLALRLSMSLLAVVLCVSLPLYIRGQMSTTDPGTLTFWSTDWTNYWAFRLVLNLIGYASICVPAGFLIRHLKRTKYNERAGSGVLPDVIRVCVFGSENSGQIVDAQPKNDNQDTPRPTPAWGTLLACFLGLQFSFLTWGVLQERIMKHEYGATDDRPGERFRNSQFLVFINRTFAFVVATCVLIIGRQASHTAPLYKYSYCSFSNIMSSWFQYEALKFISFPTQVLGKACKIIPVMLMGKLVSKKSYKYYEYITAGMISLGVSMFLLSRDGVPHRTTVTTLSGLVLMLGYMLFDSFTSNWQGELFTKYKMSSIQMMAGVNLFSVLFTGVSLVEQGTIWSCLDFMWRHPPFLLHSVLLSLSSATGQLFIYYTISQFGAVTFTIIMTVRQGIAILLSCLIYHHSVQLVGILGILVVFLAMFARMYLAKKAKAANLTTNQESGSSREGKLPNGSV